MAINAKPGQITKESDKYTRQKMYVKLSMLNKVCHVTKRNNF